MSRPIITVIKGTHRGKQPAWHFYDPATNLVVIIDIKTGDFESAWQLGGPQLEWFLKTGDVR